MPDIQRLIDEMRFRLQSQDWEMTGELRGVAEDYAAVCREANSRLRRCGEFLKQGLRSEAIHLADSQPRLLDLLASIDFPERGDWDEMVAFYQLPKPDPLLLEVAEQLNEAYALQQPLERLLDRHRLLALQRAPLPQRLVILRKIAETDVGNALWGDDVRTFEKARLAEVERTAKSAAERGDVNELTSIAAELSQPGWRETPPKLLVQRINRLSDDVGRRTARSELEELEPHLNVAFGELDTEKAREIRARWNTLAARAQLPSGDPLLERVSPALGWLDDEDTRVEGDKTYRASLTALEQVLDRESADVEAIRRAGHAVLKCDRGIPEPLNSRFNERLRSFDLVAQRRHRLIVGGAATSVALLVGIIALIVQRSSTAANARRVTDSCKQLVAGGEFEEARNLLAQHSNLSTWPEWLEAQRLLVAAETEEENRVTQLKGMLNGAENAITAVDAHSILKEARSLARTSDEKLVILQLEDHWQKVEAQAREARERQFQELLSALSDKVKKLEALHGTRDYGDDFLSLALATERGLKDLKPLSKSIASGLITQFNLVESRIDGIRKVTSALQRKASIFEDLSRLGAFHAGETDAEQKLQKYSELVREFAKDHKDDPRAPDFAIVAREIPELRGVVTWQRSSDAWRDVRPPNIETAKRRRADCQKWVDTYFHSPDAALAREYLDYLGAFVAREEGIGEGVEEGVRSALMQLFAGRLIDGVQMVETKDGRKFYMLEEKKFDKSNTVRFDYIVGFDGEMKKRTVFLSDLVADHTRLSPQSELAKEVRRVLPAVPLERWDSSLREYVVQPVQTNPKLDHLLRHFLLVKSLEHAGSANSSLKIELKPILAKLDDDKIDLAARWMDPDDAKAKVAREQAGRVLSLLDKNELAEAWSRAEGREKLMVANVRRRVQSIGWLSQGADSTWTVRTGWSPRPGQRHQMIVAVPGSVETVLVWMPVGFANDQDGIRLATDLPTGILRSGRIVFAADVVDEKN